MRLLSRIILTLFVTLIAGFVLLGVSTQNGVDITKDPGDGPLNYYVVPSGTGDCTSWATGCSFRTAVAKCPGTKTCMVYVSGGIHNTDNGSDALGTTISANYTYIKGSHPEGAIGQASRLVNSAASVTSVLVLTGNYITVEGIDFDNSDQTDKNIIMLHVKGSYTVVQDCLFRQLTGDPGGTGIKYENSGVSLSLNNNRFRRCIDYGVNMGDASRLYAQGNSFVLNGVGIYMSHANADQSFWRDTEFTGCTTAISGDAARAKTHYFLRSLFANNTSNIVDFSSYGGTWWLEGVQESGLHRYVYPTGAGTLVQKNANAYTWGTYVDIIAAGTITKPFKLQHINFQTWNAAQIFKIELFYGSASPGTTSLGIYEVVLGDPAAAAKVYTPIPVEIYVPAYATVGAKLMSSTAGIDDVTITLGYESL